MKKRLFALLCVILLVASCFAGCGKKEEEKEPVLADGVYTVEFKTDSSMFHVNEVYEGKGTLTVENGKMTLHVVLASTSIVNLYVGKAEDAQKEGAELLQPTVEEVKYPDGTTDVANAYDIPITVIDEDFDLALIGKKGVWYDHVVSVCNPVLQ